VGAAYCSQPASLAEFPYFLSVMLACFFFAGIGNASTFKQIPMIFPPRQAGGVIGWTAAVAAYGPFVFSVLVGYAMAHAGSPRGFFWGIAVFYLLNIAANYWFYMRKGAEKPC
jgi:NNP family nitrate/nitrite transporter-like MFS transporter